MNRSRSIPLRLLAAWALFIVYGTTLPFDLAPGPEALRTGWSAAHKVPWQDPAGGPPSIPDIVANVLLFVPWGFLLGLHLGGRGRRPLTLLLIGGVTALGMSVVVEFLQLFSVTRTTSATDLVTNAVGGVAGAAVAAWALRSLVPTAAPWLRTLVSREPLTALAGAALAGALLWGVAPFDVSIDVGDLKDSLKSVRLVPFGPPIRGATPVFSLWKPVPGVLAWLLLGGLVALATRARGTPRPIRTAWVVAAAAALTTEVSQLLIRSHATDATTVLFSWIGISLGVAVVARAPRSSAAALATPALAAWTAATVIAGLSPWRWGAPDFGEWTLLRTLPFIHYFIRTDVYALADALGQILLYLPAGLLLAAGRARSGAGAGAALGAVVALAVECGQLFVVGRVADITDVALGAIGGALGARALTAGRDLWSTRASARSTPPPPP